MPRNPEVQGQDHLSKLLLEYSTKNYDIVYLPDIPEENPGGNSNHLMHGVVSLRRLGAPFSLIENYCKKYAADKLVPPADSWKIEKEDEFNFLYCRRQNFSGLRDYLEEEINTISEDAVLLKLIQTKDGFLHGAQALHPLIHLGWAMLADVDIWTKNLLLAEAMAYLYGWAFPKLDFVWPSSTLQKFEPEKLKSFFYDKYVDTRNYLTPTETFVEVTYQLREDSNLIAERNRLGEHDPYKGYTRFNRRLAVVLFHPDFRHRVDVQAKKVIDRLPFDQGVTAVGRQLVLCALQLYTITKEKNEFFLLHALTSTYAMYTIMQKVGADYPQRCKDLIASTAGEWITALIAIYISIDNGCPPWLNNTRNVSIHEAYENSWLDNVLPSTPKSDDVPSWLQEAIQKAFAGKNGNENDFYDEHVFKILDVGRDIWSWPEVQESKQFRGMVFKMCQDVFETHTWDASRP